jgi:hypothetical protein
MSGRILDDRALEDVFRRLVRPGLRGSRRGAAATALLVTGQEASGKTRLMGPLADSLGLGGACRLEADDLFRVHPEFDRFALGNDKDAELQLLDDVNYLTYLAEVEIRDRGWDLVTSQPCYSPQLAVGEVEYHRAHRYDVVVAVVATHPAESLLGVADRYYNHGGRWIAVEDHSNSVSTLPEVVRAVAESESCAALHIVGRGDVVVGQDFHNAPEVAQGELVRLQELPWGVEQVERFERTRSLLPRDADPGLVREIDRLAEPKLNEFHAARRQAVARDTGLAEVVRASGIADPRTGGSNRSPRPAAERARDDEPPGSDPERGVVSESRGSVADHAGAGESRGSAGVRKTWSSVRSAWRGGSQVGDQR